ncbi:MAG: tetraacyldisaccharide 4'-kinase [Bacteroidetes bacterium]|nr:tetraacyldisaccharide 4'-kinase [Bacteroidota bacterium]
MRFIHFILLPVSICFGIITWIRNLLFDMGILTTVRFQIPVISVGNLSMGGTGKTPHIEYLIRLLQNSLCISTLSRGYGRKSDGFVMAGKSSKATDIGDEPLQFIRKFEDILVAVDEKRVRGIRTLIDKFPDLDLILLDDAFQHRSVSPGLSILLTDYHSLYHDDFVFPSGTLREFTCGARRADIIIVTKTPKVFSPITRRRIIEELHPRPHQKVYFSYIKYGVPTAAFEESSFCFPPKISFLLLFTGIANDYPLKEQLNQYCSNISTLKFPDHHQFSVKDIESIKRTFEDLPTQKKVIFTTEKDIMRLRSSELNSLLKDLPVYYLPIEIDFHEKDRSDFNKDIFDFIARNRVKSDDLS